MNKSTSSSYSPAPQCDKEEKDKKPNAAESPVMNKYHATPPTSMALVLLTILLLLLFTGAIFLWRHHHHHSSAASWDEDNMGLSPSQFRSILDRECSNELGQMSSSSHQSKWLESTEQEWNLMSANDDHETLYPLIVCDFTPNISGGSRRDHMQEFFAQHSLSSSPDKVQDQDQEEKYSKTDDGSGTTNVVTFDEFVLYNSMSFTCLLVSCPASTAAAAYLEMNKEDPNDAASEHLHLQPLLPMMKVAAGTVEAVGTAVKSSSSIRMVLTLSVHPSTTTKTTLEERTKVLLQAVENRGGRAATQQLCNVFPSTGPKYLEKSSFAAVEEDEEEKDKDEEEDPCQGWFGSLSIASTEVYTRDVVLELARSSDNHEDFYHAKKSLLSLIAGLASQPSVIAIEIMAEIRPFV